MTDVSKQRRRSSIHDERDLEVHPIQSDLVVFDHDMLLCHPCGLDPMESLGGTTDPFSDRVLKTLGRFGADLDDLSYGHGNPPFMSCACARLMVLPLRITLRCVHERLLSKLDARIGSFWSRAFERDLKWLAGREKWELCELGNSATKQNGDLWQSWHGACVPSLANKDLVRAHQVDRVALGASQDSCLFALLWNFSSPL